MQHDLVWILLAVALVSLAPIIADRVREDVSALVEVRCHDAASNFGIPLETVLGVFIPEVERAITSCGAESSVLRVERDRVDSEDVRGVAVVRWGLTMALEGKVATLVLVLDVLYSATPFDRANGEAVRLW